MDIFVYRFFGRRYLIREALQRFGGFEIAHEQRERETRGENHGCAKPSNLRILQQEAARVHEEPQRRSPRPYQREESPEQRRAGE